MALAPDYVPSGISDGEYHRFLDRILHCSEEMTHSDWNTLAFHGLAIGNSSFFIVAVSAEMEDSTASNLFLYQPISALVREELLNGQWGYQAEIDGVLVVLLCFQFSLKNEEVDKKGQALIRAGQTIVDRCCKELNAQAAVYVSQYITSALDLAEEFDHVQKRIAYSGFLGEYSGVKHIFMRDKPTPQVFSLLQFADNAAADIEHQLKEGDHKIRELAWEQLRTLQSVGPHDVNVLRDNYKYLVEQIYAKLVQHHLISPAQLSLGDVAWKYLLRCKRWVDIENKYFAFLDQLVSLYQQGRSDHSHSSITNAMIYIQENYQDPSLSVEKIAAHTEMKASTLCSSFKKYYGVTVFSCIQELRLNQACVLLKDTALPLEMVCEKAGFGSMDTMFRVFRKRRDMTPGQFRQTER